MALYPHVNLTEDIMHIAGKINLLVSGLSNIRPFVPTGYTTADRAAGRQQAAR